jgi:SAM-dependent methyltransferase
LKSKFGDKLDLYGTDLSHKSIDYAKTLKIGHFAQAAIPKVPFDKKFDVILFVDILEHLPEIELFNAILQKAKMLLKPNGLIYINIPLEQNRFTYTWFCTKLHFFENLTEKYFGHYLFFNDDRMEQLISQNKLRVLEAFYSAHVLTQIQMILFFFAPKLILDTFFGEKVMLKTRDSAVNLNSEAGISAIKLVKSVFLLVTRPLAYAAYYESRLRKNSSFLSVSGHYLLRK